MSDRDEVPADGRRHARLADLETGLEGLLHFHRVLGELMKWGDVTARQQRWYQSAFYIHADMLFTSDRRNGDAQAGAALRALRDLGFPELVGRLERALKAPINPNGRTLGQAIIRMRNEAFIHHSFDLENQGGALIYIGEPDVQMAPEAFDELIAATEDVLIVIREEKLRLILSLMLGDAMENALAAIPGTGARAREQERQRRRAQGAAAKRRAKTETQRTEEA